MIQHQLNALFNHAQKIYNLKENPCKKVKKMGKSDANKLEFWTKTEYDRFIAGIEPGSEDYLIFEILFWTGIREGELLALSLSDFDMSGNLLHINKTYNRIRKRDVIDTPKTENSVRTIDIPNFLKEEVQEYSKKHYGFPEDHRLFPIVARTLQKRLKKYEALTGVKPIRVHDIRHSHVAYLIYQGVEPLIIKERLGHKDIQMSSIAAPVSVEVSKSPLFLSEQYHGTDNGSASLRSHTPHRRHTGRSGDTCRCAFQNFQRPYQQSGIVSPYAHQSKVAADAFSRHPAQ